MEGERDGGQGQMKDRRRRRRKDVRETDRVLRMKGGKEAKE